MITLALNVAATGVNRGLSMDDPQHPRPVALGIVQWDANGTFAEYRSYIRQEESSVSATAEKSHGITSRIANSRGLPERIALAWLTNALSLSSRVVAWDLDFDLNVIRSALLRHGGNPAEHIRPLLTLTSLVDHCSIIIGKQDENGAYVPPTMQEALTAIAPESGIDPADPHARADACRVLYETLCTKGLIEGMEQAA
ncbi:hypothetical protein [Roseibium sediminis]|uniref:hypothetical protein n=1 Tax=Roseibium sediminis TaxID=1775174 RepID=UPI00123E3755|nr:hypothetical protein [Roseibium sediminis]